LFLMPFMEAISLIRTADASQTNKEQRKTNDMKKTKQRIRTPYSFVTVQAYAGFTSNHSKIKK